MLKGLTTTTLATGATVLALSLPLFADNATEVKNADHVAKDAADTNITATKEVPSQPVAVAIEKTAELPHPVAPPSPSQEVEKAAPAAPSAPAGPFAQAEKKEEVAGKANTKNTAKTANTEMTPPSGLFSKQKAIDKPKAPQQPVLSGTTKKGDEVVPAESIPVAPDAPKSMEKPVEMTPPQPENNATGKGEQGNSSSMNMPTMNMKMPATSMGTTVTPPAISAEH